MYTSITHCRICDGALTELFTVPAPLVSAFPAADADRSQLVSAPLTVVQCLFCGHVQLRHSVDPQYLYNEYWYESGVNERMRQELSTIVNRAATVASLEPGDCVLDIGANDGTLLKNYAPHTHCVAVEPAATFQDKLRSFCDATITGTFPETASQIPPNQYKIITTIAMFYDLRDPVGAAHTIRQLLHAQGVWVCQFQDLEQQVRFGVWDNFVHEHLSYHTLGTFNEVVRRAGLQIVDVERTAINGGSLRVFVRHPHATPNLAHIGEQMLLEHRTLEHPAWASRFAHRMQRNIEQIQAYVHAVVEPEEGEPGIVDLYGASTKGNTLLQATGLSDYVRGAWERNPRKYGRTTVTGVPIIDEELGRSNLPDVLLTTIWQFKSQIIAREAETLKTTALILPLPEATWVSPVRAEEKPA